MPEQPLPFANQQASGQEELGGASPMAANVVVDQTGTVYRRPGILAFAPASPLLGVGAAAGIHVTLEDRILVAYSVGGVQRLLDMTTPALPLALAGPAGEAVMLNGNQRPIFAEAEMIVAIVDGGDAVKFVKGPPAYIDYLAGTPPRATHMVAIGSRLVGNDLAVDSSRTVVRFSDVALGTITYAGFEQWSFGIGGAGAFTAEANPDPVVALEANSNELWAFGSRTLQIYGADPNTVFAPISAVELGMGAAYSAIGYDQDFNWLDSRKRFVASNGRSYDVLSDPIKRTLDGMSRVDDCWGTRVFMGPVEALVWTFPSDGRTLALQKGGGWASWLGWDGTNWTPWPVTSCAYRASNGTHLVGLSDGRIGTLSLDASTDLGLPIRAYVRTGFINRGTDALKECLCVRFTLRRGQTQSPTAPLAFFWYQDFPGQQMTKIPIDLGASGDFETVVSFHNHGVYRRRQWFFEFSSSEQLALISATETFRVLEEYG